MVTKVGVDGLEGGTEADAKIDVPVPPAFTFNRSPDIRVRMDRAGEDRTIA